MKWILIFYITFNETGYASGFMDHIEGFHDEKSCKYALALIKQKDIFINGFCVEVKK